MIMITISKTFLKYLFHLLVVLCVESVRIINADTTMFVFGLSFLTILHTRNIPPVTSVAVLFLRSFVPTCRMISSGFL